MSSSVNLLLLRAAVVLAVALPGISTYKHPRESEDLSQLTPSSLSSPTFSSSSSSALYPQLGHKLAIRSLSSMRKKRISQMSCHCCSNSFNSHCCLKCMQRVGKRSNAADPYATRHASDRQRHYFAFNPSDAEPFLYPSEGDSQLTSPTSGFERNDKMIETEALESMGVRCLCCLNQMLETPEATKWPCCSECLDQRK
ncbi:hypothetical protein RRG08_041547 [Elysia crispata]|uniref:Uncharacterized protein n=1 Tax=Elysia crispata TaxID=231223 RepID=A0AAE0ZUK1_9GAST|nr:hypothetical protein RRG08_041547 [Elysia crispata]